MVAIDAYCSSGTSPTEGQLAGRAARASSPFPRASWPGSTPLRFAPTTRGRGVEGDGVLQLDFTFESGVVVKNVRIAFSSRGPIDAPAVVVLGGISSGRYAAALPQSARGRTHGSPDGWWDGVVAPDAAIDTNRYRVISIDYLGGSGDSTSADQCISDPSQAITTVDQAHAVERVLEHLGIRTLSAFVGCSYGGMVGLAFAQKFPDRVDRLVAISAPDRPHPLATAWRTIQRRIIRLGIRTDRSHEALALARGLAMTTYRTASEFSTRFDAPPHRSRHGNHFPVVDYLDHCGARFAERYSAESILALSESIDLHRVDARKIKVPVSLLAVDTDVLVPSAQLRELRDRLPDCRMLLELCSQFGHDAFLKETAAVGNFLRTVLSLPSKEADRSEVQRG